ncbi:hypothetical protein C6A87_013505 [Mycobacterium sp. ITM-2016-00317]|uniref:rhomboid-like protein n=1 Tax=Mycobacterium sp. ITM-2016-00317 TaxID=2099694 RepID=UPI00287FAC2B|nr:rhomboid-like protein [Mycobacterium sp. ITM-2016-00317]WNG90050.1 hypothetical protein C6A87_013505 [Mycobacterium sp. ITM-2016-00317]
MRVTLCYTTLVVGVTAVTVQMAPDRYAALVRHVSTNLHNLGHGRFATLIGSAFVVDAGPVYQWLPGLVCVLAAAELLWGAWRLVQIVVAGHVVASLVVAAGLAVAMRVGWLPAAIARASDTGISYVAMAALGGLTGAIPPRWRPAWTGWWGSVAVTVLAGGPDFTDVGHVLALAIGSALSLRFGPPSGWTGPRLTLSAAGAVFGYLVLTGGAPSVGYGVAWGALGALCGLGVARLWRGRNEARHLPMGGASPAVSAQRTST